MATLQRCEVWTDFQCASGTRTAVLPLDQVTRLVTTERITREDDATLELSKDASAYTALSVGAVVRLLYDDASFEEWRIREMVDTSTAARTVTLILQSPLYDLNVRDAPITSTTSNVTTLEVTYTNQTPTQVVTAIMAFAPSWFDVGTITPTTLVNVTVSSAYPLRALRQVVDALRALGIDVELDYRRNGTTGYYLDLVTSIGSSATTVDVRTGKNLLATVRNRRLPEQASTVIARGATGVRRSTVPATMALGFWKVASVSGSDVELRGAEGCPDPIQYDDQYNSAYLQKTDGTYTQITDTVASTHKVTVASAASISANQWLRIVRNSSGDDLVSVGKPTATAPLNQSRILALPGLTDRTNWAVNPVLSRWTAGAPDSWTETDALGYLAVAEESTVILYGTKSAKHTLTQPGGAGIASVSLATASMAVAPSATSRSFTASCWFYLDKSLSTGTPNGTFKLIIGGTTTSLTYASATSQSWTRLDATATITGAAVTARLQYDAGSNAAQTLVWYLGGMLVEELDTAQSTFIVGSQPAFMLAAANRYLRLYSDPPAAYQVSFADLQAWDPASFPYDTVALGATAAVRDTDLDITTSARVVELSRDRRRPMASTITVSTRPVDLISSLTGIADV